MSGSPTCKAPIDVKEILEFFELDIEALAKLSGASVGELSRCVSDSSDVAKLSEGAKKFLNNLCMVRLELTHIFEFIHDQLKSRGGLIDINAEMRCWLEGSSLFHPLREGVPLDLIASGRIQELDVLLFEWQQELLIPPIHGGSH